MRRLAAGAALALALALTAWLVPSPPAAGPAAAGPAVVQVRVDGAAVATGFLARRGRVTTVAHALPRRRARVSVRAGGGAAPATVARLDRARDLAVLRLHGRPAGTSDRLPGRGETHLLVRRNGRQAALPARVRRRIDALIRPRPGRARVRRPTIEIDAAVRGGDSGAPLVAAGGEVIGVLYAQSRVHAGRAYALAR